MAQLRVVIFQEGPGIWMARGLEHDIVAEATSIGESVRAVMRAVDAHTTFDRKHRHEPLSAFRPAPQRCWNSYQSGTPVPLAQLGLDPPEDWDIYVAITTRNPSDAA